MSLFKLDMNYKNLLVVAGALLVLAMLYHIQSIITIFAVSFFIAYLLDPIVDFAERGKIPRSISIIFLIITMSALFMVLLAWLMPILYHELEYLIKTTPESLSALADVFKNTLSKLNLDISVETIKAQLAPKAGEIASKSFDAVTNFAASVTGAVSSIVNLALIPIITFYFLRDFDHMNEKIFNIMERKGGQRYKSYLLEFDEILSKYFRGQVIVALILSVLYTSILLIAGVKPAILIGLVSGILSIVPYLGFIIGFGTSMVLAIVQHQDVLHPMLVLGGFLVVQLLEGNLITPKIVGESLGLHPAAVIFALMAGGSLFGIAGMIIALPVAAFIKVLASEYLKA